MSKPRLPSITAAWESLQAECLFDRSPEAIHAAKTLFFSGATVLFDLHVLSGPENDAAALALLEQTHAELEAFQTENRARLTSKRGSPNNF